MDDEMNGRRRDVDVSHALDEELRESGERLKLATGAADIGIWEWDIAADRLIFDQQMQRIFDMVEPSQHISLERWGECLHPEERDEIFADVQAAVEGRREWGRTFRIIRADGSIGYVEARGAVVHDEAGLPARMIGTNIDVTHRKQTEIALRESEEAHRTLFERSPLGMMVYRLTDGRMVNINLAACRMFGRNREDMLKLPPELYCGSTCLRNDNLGQAIQAAERGDSFQFIGDGRRMDGSEFEVEVQSSPIRYHGEKCVQVIVEDISEKVAREKNEALMQERMEQTQRLESLGVLAGGIAHDFNNLLMAVLGHADLALQEISELSPAVEDLKNIKTSARRAADLCTQLLAYSGQGGGEEKTFSMSKLVDEMVIVLKTSISKKCVLNLQLERRLPMTQGDPSQMQQILMNFVINASDAIGDRSGIINISTGAMDCSQEYLSNGYVITPLEPGMYVTLEVSDNGPGMDKETLGRIFEPFFTTKFTGRGLGLSAVLGIIRSHGGGLRVYSEPGKGTTFKVLMPALDTDALHTTGLIGEVREKRVQFSGTVLLVDDEEYVRAVCGSQLKALGVNVLVASNGRDGLEVYQNNCDQIDVVILDLTMPKMGGEETFRELRTRNPDVKVVLASGYAEAEVTTRFVGKHLAGFLRKPYDLKQLSAALTGLLPEG